MTSNNAYVLDSEEKNVKIIAIKAGKLLKLHQKIKKLRCETFEAISKEIKECREVCNRATELAGELNDKISRTG